MYICIQIYILNQQEINIKTLPNNNNNNSNNKIERKKQQQRKQKQKQKEDKSAPNNKPTENS